MGTGNKKKQKKTFSCLYLGRVALAWYSRGIRVIGFCGISSIRVAGDFAQLLNGDKRCFVNLNTPYDRGQGGPCTRERQSVCAYHVVCALIISVTYLHQKKIQWCRCAVILSLDT